MRRLLPAALCLCLIAVSPCVLAQQVVDVSTRSGVTQRFLYIAPPAPKAAVILFAGGDGALQISADGNIGRLRGNFLVRSRQLFADQGLAVAVVDAPSDRKNLSGFRNAPEHAADIKAMIAWLKGKLEVPVWFIGTSRGTQSAAAAAIRLVSGGGPDGIVLTSTILADPRSTAVPEMNLEKLKIPVLVVHHEEDGCRLCQFSDIPRLMRRLAGLERKALFSFKGGSSVGNPCGGRAYHGYNGLEHDVVAKITAWITANEIVGLLPGEMFVHRNVASVVEQVRNVARTTVVQDAWERAQPLAIHGWIHDIKDGLLRDLGLTLASSAESDAFALNPAAETNLNR